MIKKTLICFCLLFAINSLFRDRLRPDIVIEQTQSQGNQIIAQSYLYSGTTQFENIIVGSSMSRRLITDSLNSFTNLAFGGESPFQGLELITRKGIYPKRVFIEMNLLFNIKDTGFSETLYNPVLLEARAHIPTMRDGKQPIPLLAAFIEHHITPQIIPYKYPNSSVVESSDEKSLIRTIEINKFMNKYSTLPKNETIETACNRLKHYTDLLSKNGSTIIFFEMPIYEGLHNSAYFITLKKTLETNFPSDKFIYIPPHNYSDYDSSDGIHLDRVEVLKYTKYFKNHVDSLIAIGK